eukprot:1195577-Prorocentrum_minimum.AAC.1
MGSCGGGLPPPRRHTFTPSPGGGQQVTFGCWGLGGCLDSSGTSVWMLVGGSGRHTTGGGERADLRRFRGADGYFGVTCPPSPQATFDELLLHVLIWTYSRRTVKGYAVDVKGYAVYVKGYDGDVKGYDGDVKGYAVDCVAERK